MDTSLSLIGNLKFSLVELVVLRAFGKMTKGRLHVAMPNGEHLYFGDGEEPVSANIAIYRSSFFKKCVMYGDIGFAESYIDGDWGTKNIVDVVSWFILNMDNNPSISGTKTSSFITNVFSKINRWYHLSRKNTVNGSRKNIAEHYDLGNSF
ncbi:MAG TPA: hypothetical protein VK750_08505, partial [Cytophagaceae bacterium]|nr:hypothetical protein [Cytophagaceae bacterium]